MLNKDLRKQAGLALAFVFLLFFPILLLTMYVGQWFVILLVALMIGYGLHISRLKCDQCGTNMWKRKTKGGLEYWGGFTIPKNCSHCGAKFG